MVAVVLMAFAASIASTTGQATDKTPRQPTGRWVVHFDDAQCQAERKYGSDDTPLALILKQPPIGGVMQVAIGVKPGARNAKQLSGRFAFDDGSPREISILRFTPPRGRYMIYSMNVPLERFDSARTAKTLQIKTDNLEVMFALSDIGPLLDVMSTCVTDLRRVWNVGESASASAPAEPAKRIQRHFRPDDYPLQAISNEESGTVVVALLVDESGKVADCSVIESSGVAVLDAQTCAALRERAKFTPANGIDGKPAKDSFIQRVTWRLQ